MKHNLFFNSSIAFVIFGVLAPFIIKIIEGGYYAQYQILSNYGDWLGGTSAPLINLAAFTMMLAAYIAQKEELKLTRTEMEATRKEFEKQNETLRIERFENTFFNLLNLHQQLVKNIVNKDKTNDLECLLGIFHSKYDSNSKNVKRDYIDELKYLKKTYLEFYKEYQSVLARFLRHRFVFIRFIYFAKISNRQKLEYGAMLAANLSPAEIVLVFYDALVGHSSELTRIHIKHIGFLAMVTDSYFFRNDHLSIFLSDYEIKI